MSIRVGPTTILTADEAVANQTHITSNGRDHGLVDANVLIGVATGLDLKNALDEIVVTLAGDPAKLYKPTRAIVRCTARTGAANGDAQVQIGSTSTGTQLVGATAVTGFG